MKQGINGFLKDTIFFLKGNKFIRLCAYPYCTFKRHLQTKRYSKSYFSAQISQWKGAYKNKRCFIIGNGPSLRIKDLEKLNTEITFSSNRIYHVYNSTGWRPDFYVAFEPEFCKTNADMLAKMEIKKARFLNINAWSRNRESNNTFWLNCTSKYQLAKLTTKNIEFSNDIAVCVRDAYSVTYTILQIAIYMGFQEIYLLGIDHYDKSIGNQSVHFYKNKKNEYQTPTYLEGIEYGYSLAKKEAEKRGIHIYNATRGGRLEVFERVDFDSLLDLD